MSRCQSIHLMLRCRQLQQELKWGPYPQDPQMTGRGTKQTYSCAESCHPYAHFDNRRNGAFAYMKFFSRKSFWSFSMVLISLMTVPSLSFAQVSETATSQVIYVPSYSRVFTQEGRSEPLASTLVVHNISLQSEIKVERVDYYDRAGQLLETLINEPVQLMPFGSINALIPIGSVGDGIGRTSSSPGRQKCQYSPPSLKQSWSVEAALKESRLPVEVTCCRKHRSTHHHLCFDITNSIIALILSPI